jgi:hypothetical protein
MDDVVLCDTRRVLISGSRTRHWKTTNVDIPKWYQYKHLKMMDVANGCDYIALMEYPMFRTSFL